jgi:hypothetical protein
LIGKANGESRWLFLFFTTELKEVRTESTDPMMNACGILFAAAILYEAASSTHPETKN